MYCVYKHTFPNNKVYIGITSLNPLRRWKQNGMGYKGQRFVFNAILKYGWDNIKHEILYSNLTKEEACQKEIELIAEYKSNNRKYGYNISIGGESHECTDEWIKSTYECKSILQYKNGILIREWRSLKQIRNEFGKTYANKVSQCVNGKRRSYQGFIWVLG